MLVSLSTYAVFVEEFLFSALHINLNIYLLEILLIMLIMCRLERTVKKKMTPIPSNSHARNLMFEYIY